MVANPKTSEITLHVVNSCQEKMKAEEDIDLYSGKNLANVRISSPSPVRKEPNLMTLEKKLRGGASSNQQAIEILVSKKAANR